MVLGLGMNVEDPSELDREADLSLLLLSQTLAVITGSVALYVPMHA